MLRQASYFFALIILVLVAFVIIERTSSPFFQSCISENERADKNAAAEKNPSGFGATVIVYVSCSGRFIEGHGVGITALASLIIAAFTGTLWFATYKLSETGQQAFQTTERAFVSLDSFDVELTTAADSKVIYPGEIPTRYADEPGLFITRFAILPRWKNSGSTPTKNMKIEVNWTGPPMTIPPEYVYNNPPEPFFLGPQSVDSSAVIEIPPAPILIDWAMKPVGVEPMILIWGRAVYEDIFGREHFTEWCRQLRFDRADGKNLRARFIQWGAYNRSDEDQRA